MSACPPLQMLRLRLKTIEALIRNTRSRDSPNKGTDERGFWGFFVTESYDKNTIIKHKITRSSPIIPR